MESTLRLRLPAFVRLGGVKGIHKSAWLLAAGSGLLQVLVFPRLNLYWLCWIALAPLMYALLRARNADATELLSGETYSYLVPARPGQGFLLGWLSGTVFYLGSCYWVCSVMHSYGGLSTPVSILLLILFSLYIGLHYGIFGLLMAFAARSRNGVYRRALLLAPFLWVAVEMLRAYVVSFPWLLLGTAQIDNVPLVRLASITGVYGVSFEIALVNSVFAAALVVPRKQRRALLVAALAAAAALQSTVLLHPGPSLVEAHATLVQQDVPIERQWTYDQYTQLLRELTEMSRRPAPAADPAIAPLIVWPESPAPFETDDRLFSKSTSALAVERKSWLLAGAVAVEPGTRPGQPDHIFNSALLLSPQGVVAQRYDKVHLVPWGEYVPFSWLFGFAKALTHEVGTFTSSSTGRAPLQVGSHSYGVFICYESVFPGEVRKFAARGAQVFVNISNDSWFGESGAPWQHLNMARMRAVENHRWLLRCTNSGITASIDPLGRVVASAPRNRRVALDAPYALSDEETFYTRYGDWFPLLCAIISVLGLVWRAQPDARVTRPQPI
jgi:apolipoprotein N-acyltransferase